MATPDFKLMGTTQAVIDAGSLPIKTGQVIPTHDSGRLFVDFPNASRVDMSSVIPVSTDAHLLAIQNPIPGKVYHVTANNQLWAYNDGWVNITGSSGGIDLMVSATAPSNQKSGDLWYQIIE